MERIIIAARLDEARPLFLLRPSPIATPLEVEMPPASLVSGLWPQLAPIILLACSNVFMTIAWYGHLKFKSVPLITVVLLSWAIAFVEYCFAVPANRTGSAVYSPAELKTIQEVITLIVFAGFTAIYFKEPLSLTQSAGFALIALGAALVFPGQG
jgi:uncharacterized protein (DUF486 family)